MSRENLEIVREIYEAWMSGDWAYDRLDPEIAMVESQTLPGAASAFGLEAVQRYMKSFNRYWEEIRFEPQEYIDAGADRVVVVARLVGRGKGSGVPVNRMWAYVWTLRDGRALRMDGYENRAEALAAAGVDE